MLSTTVPLPPSVSNSIVSAVAMTASSMATVSVIINEVYALGLPCADESDDESKDEGGLSTGAKAAIGVGAGVGGLLLLGLFFFLGICVQRRARRRKSEGTNYSQPPDKQTTTNPGSITPAMSMGSQPGQMSPQFQTPNLAYGFPANQNYNPNMPHTSWMSQTPSIPPQYRPPTVEMQVPHSREIYEIGDQGREASPVHIDKNASANDNVPTFNISAHDAQH
jgi:hypothetical protein